MLTLPLPLTVTVSPSGAVSIDHPAGMLAMNRHSLRAGFLSNMLGEGTHDLNTPADVDALPFGVAHDLALAVA